MSARITIVAIAVFLTKEASLHILSHLGLPMKTVWVTLQYTSISFRGGLVALLKTMGTSVDLV